VQKPERKSELGRPVRRWENSIKIYFIEKDGVIWIGFVWLGIETSGRFLLTQ
jgi:hypothetical protein